MINKTEDEMEERNEKIVGECPNCGSKNYTLRFEPSLNFESEFDELTIICSTCAVSGKVQFIPYLIEDTVDWGEYEEMRGKTVDWDGEIIPIET